MSTIIIGGDLVPTLNNLEYFASGEIEKVIGKDLLEIINSVDYRIYNLEAPITDTPNPIKKHGPHLQIPVKALKGIKNLNPTVLSLANNHIMDHGEINVQSTLKVLKEIDIKTIGADSNLQKAQEPLILNDGKNKVGIYACAEHEFSIAQENKAGANPYDPLNSFDHVEKLCAECDYVVVLYHGGKEHYRYPSPMLQKICKKFVDKGADLVICQHSHCIGCEENYKEAKIIYGQGNFIFNKHDNEFWNSGMLIKINISNRKIEYIPFIKNDIGIVLAEGELGDNLLKSFYNRSKEILEADFIEENYDIFAKKMFLNYIYSLSGLGKLLSRIDRRIFKSFFIKRIYKNKLLSILNYIECEAHRELFIKGLRNAK